ncbi:MAG: hypothetical protein AAGE59_25800, partial [Cyanobacteria bacterium P01_F01_bin.86]
KTKCAHRQNSSTATFPILPLPRGGAVGGGVPAAPPTAPQIVPLAKADRSNRPGVMRELT